MAYSDYGAYIWKNGENITNECADVSCKIIEGKFVFKNWYDNLVDEVNKNENEKEKTISGHALINLEKFCISFYKTYNPEGRKFKPIPYNQDSITITLTFLVIFIVPK